MPMVSRSLQPEALSEWEMSFMSSRPNTWSPDGGAVLGGCELRRVRSSWMQRITGGGTCSV